MSNYGHYYYDIVYPIFWVVARDNLDGRYSLLGPYINTVNDRSLLKLQLALHCNKDNSVFDTTSRNALEEAIDLVHTGLTRVEVNHGPGGWDSRVHGYTIYLHVETLNNLGGFIEQLGGLPSHTLYVVQERSFATVEVCEDGNLFGALPTLDTRTGRSPHEINGIYTYSDPVDALIRFHAIIRVNDRLRETNIVQDRGRIRFGGVLNYGRQIIRLAIITVVMVSDWDRMEIANREYDDPEFMNPEFADPRVVNAVNIVLSLYSAR